MNYLTRLAQKYQFKLLLIISIFLFLLNVILILRNRATEYEDSIYSNIQTIIWIFLFLNLICGIYLMTIYNERDSFWLAGLAIILLNNMFVLMLPVLKGYVLYGKSDTLTHIGLVKDILSYGFFEKENFYPITHVLFSEIALIGNIQPFSLFNYMPVFFNISFVLFMYFFAKSIFKKKEYILIATASGGILSLGSFHTQITPNGVANFLYPLFIAVLFLRNSKNKFSYNFLLLTSIALLPFLHPLTTVALIFTVVMFKISFFIMELSDAKNKEIFRKMRQRATTPLLLILIIFITWISTFLVWGQTVRSIFHWLWGEVTTTPINAMVSTLNKIDISGVDVLELYIRMYGHLLIFIILSTITSSIIIKKVLLHKKFEFQNLFSLIIIFFGFILFLIWLLLVPMGFGSLRILAYPSVIAFILGSFGIYELIKTKFNTKKYIASLAILIILIVAYGIGIFNVFDSPYILKPNLQITQAEMEGYKWTFDHKNPKIAVSAIMSSQPYRIVDALWGVKARLNRSDVKDYGAGPEAIIPDHFNYTNYSTAGSSYSSDRYILLSEYDKHMYLEVWKVVGRYNSSDFERISYDPTMQKIYTNGGFDTWITTTGEKYEILSRKYNQMAGSISG